MSKTVEQKALEAYPDTYTKYRKEGDPEGVESGICTIPDTHNLERIGFVNGYEQAEKDTIERACEWLSKHYDIDLAYFRKTILEEK